MIDKTKQTSKFDLTVYFSLVALGILHFLLSPRSADYLHDTNYFELANSVIHKAHYGFNGKPMTQLPPGLPYLMAILYPIIGISYTTMIHLMTIFAVLGLIVTYKLIRDEQDRVVAALACLLFASSPFFFAFSTSLVFADLPYFFLSMVLLLMALNLDRAKSWGTSQKLQWFIWGPLLVATVLVKSVAIAFLVGCVYWLGASCLMNWETGKRRLKIFLPLLILGITVQVSWMVWASQHQYHDWPLSGYQENYVAQLRLKNANQPELGLATWRDVVLRPFASGDDMAAALFGVFTHKEMAPAWYSPGTALPLLIVSIGLLGTFMRTGGGPLEWYFLSYQAMFLFWPWDYERRFFLPVAPLAFLYAWRGGKTVWEMLCKRPTILGPAGLTLAVLGSLSSLMWGKQTSHPNMWACLAGWLLVAGCSILVFLLGSKRLESVAIWLKRPFTIHNYSVARWLGSLAGMATCVFVIGVGLEVKSGLENLRADLTADDFDYPEIEAGQWIKLNSAPSSVVMARKDDMIFHYSQRKVIWFPASRDPEILLAGIIRHQVRYVVIHEGNDTYWRPPARECFDGLLKKYPNFFRVVHLGPHNTIYEVSPEGKWVAANSPSSQRPY
jgi:hypothetical protein